MVELTKPPLTIDALVTEAETFSIKESTHDEPSLYGVTDGKAVGTYLEHKFIAHLMNIYDFTGGNSALGIDIPSINVDIKVTSIKQPQSSCPFRSARQKYGDLVIMSSFLCMRKPTTTVSEPADLT